MDRATAIGNVHKKFGEDRTCSFRRYGRRQTNTHTHTQTDTLITILRCPIGGGVIRRNIVNMQVRARSMRTLPTRCHGAATLKTPTTPHAKHAITLLHLRTIRVSILRSLLVSYRPTADLGPDLQNILRQSYDYLTIMP